MAKAKTSTKGTTTDTIDETIEKTIRDAQQTEVIEEKTEVSTHKEATAKAGKRSA